MKKIVKKWFSLIELIIVISIMAIISVWGLSYFTGFIDDLKISNAVYEIKGDLDSLDNKVNKKEIFDYELYFSGSSLYYYSYENIFDLDYKLNIGDVDLITWSWVVEINWAVSGTGIIRSYWDYKFIKQEEVILPNNFTWKFGEYKNYTIKWNFSGQILNNIVINYFSDSNLDLEKQDYIRLIWINAEQDKSWDSYDKIVVKNILWKKIFYNNLWAEIDKDKIYLFFENNIWKIESLEISK